jgi:hypothetical protein
MCADSELLGFSNDEEPWSERSDSSGIVHSKSRKFIDDRLTFVYFKSVWNHLLLY